MSREEFHEYNILEQVKLMSKLGLRLGEGRMFGYTVTTYNFCKFVVSSFESSGMKVFLSFDDLQAQGNLFTEASVEEIDPLRIYVQQCLHNKDYITANNIENWLSQLRLSEQYTKHQAL